MKQLSKTVLSCAFALFLSCGKNQNPEALARLQDSLRKVAKDDSLFNASVTESLSEPLGWIDQPRLDSAGSDCFRMIALFSWGVSPIGPVLSIRGCDDSSNYVLTIHTLEPGKDPDNPDQRRRRMEKNSLTAESFKKISDYLDSIRFESISAFVQTDYVRHDASQYYIERYRNSQYHCIIRSSYVDPLVYHLFAEASDLAGIDPKMIEEFKRREAEARRTPAP